jgi:hypothetical protein
MSRCWTRLAFSISPRSSCRWVATVLTDSGTETWADEISVARGKADTSASGDELRRITMGMTGLGVTLRLLSDCSRDVVVTSELDVDELRRITMGMSGLGVTLRLLSDCSRGVVVTSEFDVELAAVGFETV